MVVPDCRVVFVYMNLTGRDLRLNSMESIVTFETLADIRNVDCCKRVGELHDARERPGRKGNPREEDALDTGAASARSVNGASKPHRDGGLARVIPALVLSSVLGYGIQLLAPFLLGSLEYVEFSAFWSALFLGVAALSGVQNEVARSSLPEGSSAAAESLRRYAVVVGFGAAVGGAIGGAVVGGLLGSDDSGEIAVAMALGLGGFVILAIQTGTLYGAGRWTGVALAIIADPGLRALVFLAIAAFALAGSDTVPLGTLLLATVLPFIGAAIVVWWGGGRATVRAVFIEQTWARLLRNSFHTVAAATALGFVAAGMPLVIAAIGQGEEPSVIAGAVLAVVLLRAPLVSPMLALQSYLTVTFRDAPSLARRRSLLLTAGLLLAGGIAALAVAWGAQVADDLLSPLYTLPPVWVLVAIVFAAALVGIQSIAGAAALARGSHRVYSLGWVTTAAGVLVTALLPLPFEVRLTVALTLPVAVGLAVHLLGLSLAGRRRSHAV